jgi:hypothetical protein
VRKLIAHLRYVKRRGFRNYWYYLRLKRECSFWDLDLPNYDKTVEALQKLAVVVVEIGIKLEKCAGILNELYGLKETK